MNFCNNNMSEIIPIVFLSPAVKVWKECSRGISKSSFTVIEDKLIAGTFATESSRNLVNTDN